MVLKFTDRVKKAGAGNPVQNPVSPYALKFVGYKYMNIFMRVLRICISIIPLLILTCATPENTGLTEPMEFAVTGHVFPRDGTPAGVPVMENESESESSDTISRDRRFTGREVLEAFTAAYPGKIEKIDTRGGDWAVLMDDVWFYWAEGRLLPEHLKDSWEQYAPYPFYRYTRELPPVPNLSEEEKKSLSYRLQEREENPPSRHPAFFNALWKLDDRESSWQKVKTTYFLGLKVEIHRELLEDLASVEEEIQRNMLEDPDLKEYVDSLVQLEGYNWRMISGTASLSFHSYGTAVDILPGSYGGKQAYWLWAKPYFPEWYSLPYEDRFMPPESFIHAFEKHGFIWGGKWFFFDTIHFEYKPEILFLNGLL